MTIRGDLRQRMKADIPRHVLTRPATFEGLFDEYRWRWKHLSRPEFRRVLRELRRDGMLKITTETHVLKHGGTSATFHVTLFSITAKGRRMVKKQ